MSGIPLRVVKIGGSLFDLPSLGERLNSWRLDQPSARDVFIGGGGRFADEIRRLEGVHGWGDEASHWLCVEILGMTAQLIHQLIPDARVVKNLAEVDQCSDRSCILDCRVFCRENAQSGELALPRSWDATTDAIAASVADTLGAHELVLLKSTAPPARSDGDVNLESLVATGFVDRAFASAIGHRVAIRAIDCRAAEWNAVVLRRRHESVV